MTRKDFELIARVIQQYRTEVAGKRETYGRNRHSVRRRSQHNQFSV